MDKLLQANLELATESKTLLGKQKIDKQIVIDRYKKMDSYKFWVNL